MKKLRFHDVVETRQFEYEEKEDDFEEYTRAEVEEVEYEPAETAAEKWEKANRWSGLFVYIFYLSAFGTTTAIFPGTIFSCTTFTTGTYIILTSIITVIVIIPMMYLEMFLGLYSKRTNLEMYRMFPIYFGVSVGLFVLNIIYIFVEIMKSSVILVAFIGMVMDSKSWITCNSEAGCHDYRLHGRIYDNCTHGPHMAIYCERLGKLRYPLSNAYWKYFKDPTIPEYPNWEFFSCNIVMWVLVFLITSRKFVLLGKVYAAIVFIKYGIMIMIYSFTETPWVEITMSTEIPHISDLFGMVFITIYRMGLFVPLGIMTNSAYVKHSRYLLGEVGIIVGLHACLTFCEIWIANAVANDMGNKFGAPPRAMMLKGRAYYVVFITEFILSTSLPTEFCYIYFSIIFLNQIIETVMYIKLMMLNIYGWNPKWKTKESLLRLLLCGTMMIFGTSIVFKSVNAYWLSYITVLFLTLTLPNLAAFQLLAISCIYGVQRLSDDIHFTTGRKPMKVFRIAWYILPLLFWTGFFVMITTTHNTVSQKYQQQSLLPDEFEDTVTYLQSILYILCILGTISYIFTKMGTEKMVINLFRPQFYWGPVDKEVRMKRKAFTPSTAIRSEPTLRRKNLKKIKGKKDKEPVVKSEFYDRISKARVFNDNQFFASIGISRDHYTLLTIAPEPTAMVNEAVI